MTAELVDTTPKTGAAGFLAELEEVVEAAKAGAARRDRTREYARMEIEALRRIRFWALTVPPEFGGLGLGPETVMAAVFALARVDGSLSQIPQNHFASVERIRLTTTGDQRNLWLGRLGAGAVLGNATAEPGERHPGEHGTAVVYDGSGWTLSGRKVYATGSLLSDHIAVAAKDHTGAVRTVVVDTSAPGVVIQDDWNGLGQRTTASGTAEFHDVAVADHAVLPAAVDPVATYRISGFSQLIHAAIDAGIAAGAVDEAVGLDRRVHAGRGSGVRAFTDDALGVAQLGELHITALTARRLVEAAATRLAHLHRDSDLTTVVDVFYEVAAAKVVSTRAALAVTTALFDIGGTASTTPALGLDRYWRDARTHTLHDAVRWKPNSIARWLLDAEVADPWSIGAPFACIDDLRQPERSTP